MSEREQIQLKSTAAAVVMSSPATGRNWQFGIRHLLGLMTYVAVMLGIATWQGPQTLMVTTGLGLALLSHVGAFQRLQIGRTQLMLVGIAWVVYLVSLCTPCTTGPFTVYGWQAAWIYLYGPLEGLIREDTDFQLFAWPWIVTIDMSNLLGDSSFTHLAAQQERGQVLAVLSCLAMVGPWTTLVMASDLYVAYYVWCASFMLLAIAVPVNRLTLMGMACIAMVHILIFRVFGTAP